MATTQLAGLALGFEVPGWPVYPESDAATIKGIQELAGHKTIQMSVRYSHLSPDHKLSVIERISATGRTNSHRNSHQLKKRHP
jgi:hypothetical protein